jgi:hypothetical protein
MLLTQLFGHPNHGKDCVPSQGLCAAMKHLMGFPSAKLFSAAALTLLLSPQAGFSASDLRQTCSGVLTHDDDGYMLIADPDSKSLWCAASIGEDEKSPQVKRVLKTCTIGSHCHIVGSFTGHGLFYWTRISSVSLLKP